jgi:hypothetical protein
MLPKAKLGGWVIDDRPAASSGMRRTAVLGCLAVVALGLLVAGCAGPSRSGAVPLPVMSVPRRVPHVRDLAKELARAFFARYADDVDQLVLWFDPQIHGIETFYLPVKNDVDGIGAPLLDASGDYGSRRLRGIIVMGDEWTVAHASGHDGPRSALGILAQETAHSWAAFMVGGPQSPPLRGRENAHWSFFVDTGGSPMGGNAWELVERGVYRTAPAHHVSFSDLDLYAMGLLQSTAVRPVRVVRPAEYCAACDGDRALADTLLRAEESNVTIEDVVHANGERLSHGAEAARDLRQGWIYIVPEDARPAGAAFAATKELRERWPPLYADATRSNGRVTVATTPKS